MFRTHLTLTILLILASSGVIAEPFNRPPYPYLVNGYYYPYPVNNSLNSWQPVTITQQEQENKEPTNNNPKIASPAKNSNSTINNEPPLTIAPDNTATPSAINHFKNSPIETGEVQSSPKNSSAAQITEPKIKEERHSSTMLENTPLQPTVNDTPQIAPSSKTALPAIPSEEKIEKEPTPPVAAEPTLSEQLLQSQPLIEAAIKSSNFAEAYYLWRPLAEAGAPSAQYGIGWMYHNGYGLAINDQKAYAWWARAASQNYVEAIFSIGTLYQFGYGMLKKDMKTALSYYLMAAVAGHDESRLILKTMLEKRDHRIKPILLALLIYHLNSAIAGDHESQEILKQMLLSDDPRIVSIRPRLLNHYRDSAISGDKEAQHLLRSMMLNGDSQVELIVAELIKNHPKILGNIPATVRVKYANSRMGPGTQHKIIKVLKQGDKIIVLDRKDGWFLAQIIGQDKRAWISAKLVTLNP